MNLRLILDDHCQKILKFYGLYVSDNMDNEEMDSFHDNLLASDMPSDIIDAVLEQIEYYETYSQVMDR